MRPTPSAVRAATEKPERPRAGPTPALAGALLSVRESWPAEKYGHAPVWGEIEVTAFTRNSASDDCMSRNLGLVRSVAEEGSDSTRINAKATTLPNLFTLMFSPERKILDDFAQAVK